MKIVKLSFIIVAIAVLSFGLSSTSFAFHSGGVAECEGCHTMHNTKTSGTTASGHTGSPSTLGVGIGAAYLLQGSDQSSTCLNCHNQPDTDIVGTTKSNSYHISTDSSVLAAGVAPVELTPGGDFAWLKKTYVYSVRGTATTDEGASHGHNINAADYGYTGTDNTSAPGGTYDQAKFTCTSCHDPHSKARRFADGSVATTGLPIYNSGSYNNSPAPTANVSAVGVYRFLGGAGYVPASVGGAGFTYPAPDAVAPSTYNRSEHSSQTIVAYGQGMSEWCANCHSAMLENAYLSGTSGHRHPAGNSSKLTTAIVANYNSYVTSGVMTNTDVTKAFTTLAPFEKGMTGRTIADYAALKSYATTSTSPGDHSAATTNNVMCLSCHRAHASGFPDMTRYFLENEFMTIGDSAGVAAYDSSTTEGKINFGKNVAEQTAAYYGRPASVFGPYARNLCNKCHAKD
jgi:hypothetical protein